VKMSHKVNHGWTPPASPLHSDVPDVPDERYEAEIAQALSRAERSWRRAQRALEHAESRAVQGEGIAAIVLGDLRAEVEKRFADLRELEIQMQAAPGYEGSNRANKRSSPRSVTPKGTML
jgi:hypothetical protein